MSVKDVVDWSILGSCAAFILWTQMAFRRDLRRLRERREAREAWSKRQCDHLNVLTGRGGAWQAARRYAMVAALPCECRPGYGIECTPCYARTWLPVVAKVPSMGGVA